jgi:AraC family transcriptional regulator of adaptative response/methylated-DNA-[protein]-cysteine methyltransferase
VPIDLNTPGGRVAVASSQMQQAAGPIPTATLARSTCCSPRQLQRDFVTVLGVTPRQYGASVRTDSARRALRTAASVSDAVYGAGYGSVRGFYDEAAQRLGMTPQEYAEGAAGRTLLWSVAESSLGDILAVASPEGLCAARIGSAADMERQLRAEFAAAQLVRDDAAMVDVMGALQLLSRGLTGPQVPVAAAGTAFQARVWAALQRIPAGETRSYRQVAEAIGAPRAVRAVAAACAANPVALAIPCHRVLRSDGSPAGYRWGLAVKRALLAAERESHHRERPVHDRPEA